MIRSSESLRIGIACFSSFGGSGVVASEIGMALGRRGHRVCFLSDRPPARLDLACPNVSFHEVALLDYPLVAHQSYALALTAKMIELVHAEKLDLLHAHYALPHSVSAALAAQVLGANPPKLITTLHGTDVTLVDRAHGLLPLTRFAVAASDGITAPSRWLAETAYTNLGLDRTIPIEVIPNFVDTAAFVPPPFRTRHPPYILTHVSNFRPLKRVDLVIGVLAALNAKIPAELQLVGDGPERPRAQALVHELGLQDRVRFRGEIDDLLGIYQMSDVFLLPSATESFGLAALEAMACGVPVVASDVGGLPEVVADGETGFLTAAGDVAAMAEAVLRLASDGALHRRMSRLARERVEAGFRLAPAIDRYEALYRRVLGS